MNKFINEIIGDLTYEEASDAISAAIHGGIGYWCCIDNTTDAWLKAKAEVKQEFGKGNWYSEDVFLRVLLNGDNITLIEYGEETEEGEIYTFNRKNLENALNIYLLWKEMSVKNAIKYDTFDAEDGDALIQFAVFGDIIFD